MCGLVGLRSEKHHHRHVSRRRTSCSCQPEDEDDRGTVGEAEEYAGGDLQEVALASGPPTRTVLKTELFRDLVGEHSTQTERADFQTMTRMADDIQQFGLAPVVLHGHGDRVPKLASTIGRRPQPQDSQQRQRQQQRVDAREEDEDGSGSDQDGQSAADGARGALQPAELLPGSAEPVGDLRLLVVADPWRLGGQVQ